LFSFIAPFTARAYKPDIIHAILESFAGLALVFCKRTVPKAKRILTCQSTNTSLLLSLMHRSANTVTAISSVLIARAKKMGRNDAILIPNGIRLQDISAACKGVKKIPGRILFVGRLEPMKGVATLLDAFASIANTYPEAELHIVGAGSLRATLQARYPDLVQRGRIVFRGYVPPISLFGEYAVSSIFCALSRSEALGNVFLEAQAAGCAIVATDVGGIPDIVKHNEAGFLVPSGDSNAAANAIIRLLSDSILCKKFGEVGVKHAEKYDWAVIAKKYGDVYRTSISGIF
jgi:glycosyltransferase involved in cell wall biosynthesis